MDCSVVSLLEMTWIRLRIPAAQRARVLQISFAQVRAWPALANAFASRCPLSIARKQHAFRGHPSYIHQDNVPAREISAATVLITADWQSRDVGGAEAEAIRGRVRCPLIFSRGSEPISCSGAQEARTHRPPLSSARSW